MGGCMAFRQRQRLSHTACFGMQDLGHQISMFIAGRVLLVCWFVVSLGASGREAGVISREPMTVSLRRDESARPPAGTNDPREQNDGRQWHPLAIRPTV